MQTDDITIRVGTTRQQLDAHPENTVLTANEWGPDKATFTLTRTPDIPWADLTPRTPVEIEVAGSRVWKGRIKATPSTHESVTVEAVGLQYALDDAPFRRLYVHNNMGDWKDWRTNPNCSLQTFTDGWTVDSSGSIYFRCNNITGLFPKGGVYLDLGFDDAAKRVVFTWAKNQWAGTGSAYLLTSDTVTDLNGAGSSSAVTRLDSATSTGTFAATVSARYVQIVLDNDVAEADDRYFRVTDLMVFGDTAWEAANTSTLKSSQVVADAILQGKGWTDTSRITATTGTHLQLDALDYATARELINTVNAFENNTAKVDADGIMVYEPKPSTPTYLIQGDYQLDDGSLNSDDDVYDEVAIIGTFSDGSKLIVERTQTGTVFDQLPGESAKKIIDVGGAITQASGETMGDSFLEQHQQSPFKGSVTVTGMGDITGPAGEPVHPSRLLRDTGDMVSIQDQTDPTRKVPGRRAYLVGVTYNHAERSAVLDLDASRRDFAKQLAQYSGAFIDWNR